MMKQSFSKMVILFAVLCATLIGAMSLQAGERVLTNNSGDASAPWFISGEPTMILNGFDLSAQGIALPAVIDRISIAVEAPVPGQPIDVVVYQDANGGSPADSTLAGTTQVDITQAGTFTVTLPTPITVTQPAVWVGFYLPVDFRFLADTSGTSVLTYWAWTPGGRFNINSLASAAILGPSDGSAPVNINLNGKARITAEITGAGGVSGTPAAPGATPVQVAGAQTNANVGVLVQIDACTNALYDTADEIVSYRSALNVRCRISPEFVAPSNPLGYLRRGQLYDIQFYEQNNGIASTDRLRIAVTHCIRPDAADLDRALIGNAWGSPRVWRILPTQRFNDVVCAEVRRGGNLAYFVPG